MKYIFFLIIIISIISGCGSYNSRETAANQFSFAVFGDNSPDDSNDSQPEVFKTILKSIQARNEDFAFNNGDCINALTFDSFKQKYEEYKNLTSTLYKSKIYIAVGNHDIEKDIDRQNFIRNELGRLYTSFDYKDSHFIILDSEIVGQEARVTGDQLKWLKNDLAMSQNADHRFVFIHQPLYPVDGHTGNSMDEYPAERDALHHLFADNNVDIVFSGHEHIYYNQLKDGVRYIITGGAGSSIYDSPFDSGSFHHFVIINAGNTLKISVIKVD